jgi:hypothetical protein
MTTGARTTAKDEKLGFETGMRMLSLRICRVKTDAKGDLKNARAFQKIAAGRANLLPDVQPNTQVSVSVLSFAAIKPPEEPET